MKYYSLLNSTVSSDVAQIPAKVVLDRFSPVAATLISKPRIYKDGAFKPKFETVGDLMKLRREDVYDILSDSKLTHKEVDEALLCVEEAMASLGLKFSDSDFTVGDVRIIHLGLGADVLTALSKAKHGVKTIDDLTIFGADRLISIDEQNGRKYVARINAALEAYGMKMEGSGFTIDRSKQFPIDIYFKYLGEETQKKLSEKMKKDKENQRLIKLNLGISALKRLKEDQIRMMNVKCLGLQQKIVDRLEEVGIESIDDLIKKGHRAILAVDASVYANLKLKLAELNLKFDRAHYEIIDGKIVQDKSPSIYLSEYAKAPFDFMEASDKEKQKFLGTTIRKFGFTPIVYNSIPYEIETIGDLIETIRSGRMDNNRTELGHIKNALKVYNITFESKPVQTKTRYLDMHVLKSAKKFSELTDEEQQELLKKGLTECGVYKEYAALLKEKLGVSTMGELYALSRSEIRENLGENGYAVVCKFLSHYGLYLKKEKIPTGYKERINYYNVMQLGEAEREAFLSSPLTRLGVTASFAEAVKDRIGITTIGELTKRSQKELLSSLGPYQARRITISLQKWGLKLTPHCSIREKKREELKKILKTSMTRSTAVFSIGALEGEDPLSEETKQKVLSTRLDTIGLSVVLSRKLAAKNIYTIGDAIKLRRVDIANLTNSEVAVKIEKLVEQYGLAFKRAREKKLENSQSEEKPKAKKVTEKKQTEKKAKAPSDAAKKRKTSSLEGKNASKPVEKKEKQPRTRKSKKIVLDESLTPEQRRELLNPEKAGLFKVSIERLKEHGITSLAELDGMKRSKVVEIFCRSQGTVKRVQEILALNGMSLEYARKKESEVVKFKRSDLIVPELETEDREELLKTPMSSLKIGEAAVKAFEDAGIVTLGDISSQVKSNLRYVLKSRNLSDFIVKLAKKYDIEFLQVQHEKKPKQTHETKQEVFGGKTTLEMSEEEKKAFLEMDVGEIGFSPLTVSRLKAAGTTTVQDLANMSYNELLASKVSTFSLHKIVEFLRTYKVERKKQRTYSVSEITSRPREEALALSVESMDFSAGQIERLKEAGVTTLGDFSTVQRGDLWRLLMNKKCYAYVNKIMEELEISREPISRVKRPEIEKEYGDKLFDEMTDEEKKAFLSTPLEKAGISHKIAERLREKGIKTLGDAKAARYTALKLAASTEVCNKVKAALALVGLKMDDGRSLKPPKTVAISKEEFAAMSEEEKKKALDRPLEDFGITAGLKKLHENGIYTFSELLEHEKKEVVSLMLSYGYKRLNETLSDYGLELKGRHKSRNKDVIVPSGRIDEMSEEDKKKTLALGVEHLGFGKFACKTMEENGIYTLGDMLGVEYEKFMSFFKNNKFIRERVEEIKERFGVKFAKKGDAAAEEVDESLMALSPLTRERLLLSGIEKPEDAKKYSRMQLREIVKTPIEYKKLMQILEEEHVSIPALTRDYTKKRVEAKEENPLLKKLIRSGVEAIWSMDEAVIENGELEEALALYFTKRYEEVMASPNEKIMLIKSGLVENEKLLSEEIIAERLKKTASAPEKTQNEGKKQEKAEEKGEEDEDDKI